MRKEFPQMLCASLCHSISETYENIDEESIEGTNGIWQVSFLSECIISCKCADASYHII